MGQFSMGLQFSNNELFNSKEQPLVSLLIAHKVLPHHLFKVALQAFVAKTVSTNGNNS
jgi:hypothetical protein